MTSIPKGQIFLQGFRKGRFLDHFLLYIDDLSDNLSSNPKITAADTSLFSVVHDISQAGIYLNDDLKK